MLDRPYFRPASQSSSRSQLAIPHPAAIPSLPLTAAAALHCGCAAQFIYFVDEFQLVSRDEQAPLRDLIDNIYRKDVAGPSGGRGAAGGGGGGGSAPHEDTLTKEQDVLAK